MRMRCDRTGASGSPRSSRNVSSAAVGPSLLICFLDHDAHVTISEHIAEHAAADASAVILALTHAAAGDVDIVPDRRDQAKPTLLVTYEVGYATDLFVCVPPLGRN